MRKYPVILLVDDSKAFRLFCRTIIKKSVRFVRICEAEDGAEGLKLYVKYKPDLILLDYRMLKFDGKQVLEYIRKNDIETRVIMISAWVEDQSSINELMKLGAFSFVPKPMNRTILMKAVKEALLPVKTFGNYNRRASATVLSTNYD